MSDTVEVNRDELEEILNTAISHLQCYQAELYLRGNFDALDSLDADYNSIIEFEARVLETNQK